MLGTSKKSTLHIVHVFDLTCFSRSQWLILLGRHLHSSRLIMRWKLFKFGERLIITWRILYLNIGTRRFLVWPLWGLSKVKNKNLA